jgi:hypothetical protein
MKSIVLFIACMILPITLPAQTSSLIQSSQARDLRLLVSAGLQIESGAFLLDTSFLNSSSTKTAAHGRFFLPAPQTLASILSGYKRSYPENIFLSNQSSILVFSKNSIIRRDMYLLKDSDLSDVVINEGDIVILGNFGDYL